MYFIVPFLFLFILVWAILLLVAGGQFLSSQGKQRTDKPTKEPGADALATRTSEVLGVVKVSRGMLRASEKRKNPDTNKRPSDVAITITITSGKAESEGPGAKSIPIE